MVNVLLRDLEKLSLADTLVIIRCNTTETLKPIDSGLNVHFVYNEFHWIFKKS